jgi:hypothetical protein
MTPKDRRCKAIQTEGQCRNLRHGSHATCKPCAARIAMSMHHTMNAYGMETADLVAHWKRYHAQDVTCPTCFAAAHARRHNNVKLPLTGPFPFATV